MPGEAPKRPRRTPFTQAEVAEMIALKKKREHLQLVRLRSSPRYKIMNVFNLACFFVYLEIVFCFYGPSHYEYFQYSGLTPRYRKVETGRKDRIAGVDILAANGYTYTFLVKNDTVLPPASGVVMIGEDYLLKKDLKGVFSHSDTSYRLFSASPVLLLSWLVLVISFVAFCYNLNQNAYSLMALTVLNCLTMTGILLL